MLREQHRILSSPIKIHWAGWETDTLRLQQAGWSLSAEQDIYRDAIRIAMKHDDWRVRGITDPANFPYRRMLDGEEVWRQVGLRARLASDFRIQMAEMGPHGFAPIDAMPQLCATKIMSLEDFAHFAAPLARTQEIVIPEQSVSDLLGKILEMQEPAKNKYFRDLVRDEGAEVRQRQKFHAQILSIAA